MTYLFGLMIVAWVAAQQVLAMRAGVEAVSCTLGALGLFIVKEKFLDRLWAPIGYFFGAAALSLLWGPYSLLACIPVFDFAHGKRLWLAVPALAGAAALGASGGVPLAWSLPALALALFAGHAVGAGERNERANAAVLDGERRLRYDLERAQAELIRSRKEIESLTEARERNRIAHELHDSVGHGIAGVRMQLEAALRIHRRDPDKAGEILKLCTDRLSETLELTRAAAHNLRSGRKTGVEALEKIVGEFTYCPVEFRHTGDFGAVSSTNLRILEANVTEALTNAARHSRATRVTLSVDIRRRNVRLCYRDDGVGCADIRENLGLTGMRERVRNAGGTLSVDGSDGFLIVCNLPERGEGEEP